jgi:hypothetical protein
VRHVIGGASLPAGWQAVVDLTAAGPELVLKGDRGELRLPFDGAFLAGR